MSNAKKRFFRRLKPLCCAFIVLGLLLCVGCGQHAAQTPAASTPVFAPEPTPQPEREPMREITAISPTGTPTFAPAGNGRVFSCWTSYEEDSDASTTHLDLVNLEEDRSEASGTVEGYVELVRSFSDGTALLRSYQDDCCFLLEQDMTMTRVELPSTDGLFNADHSLYYYVQNEALLARDIATGTDERVSSDPMLRMGGLGDISADGTLISAWVYTSFYSYESSNAVIDLSTGKLLMLQASLGTPSFDGETIFARNYDYDAGDFQLLCGSLTDGTPLQLYTLDTEDNLYCDLQVVSGSDYAVCSYDTTWSEEAGVNPNGESSTTLYHITQDGITVCPLTDYGFDSVLYPYTYLADTQSLLGSSYQDSRYVTTLIDLTALTFQPAENTQLLSSPDPIEQETLDAYLAELASPELSAEGLTGVRAKADGMEDTYGIHILLSDQCTDPCSVSGYEVTTSDQAGWVNEAASIDRALDQLDEVLSVYPEGFFRQFCTESEGSGLYVMLTGPIGSDQPFEVAAFEQSLGMREYVGVDITTYDLLQNYHHEIWHAIDNKIDASFYAAYYDGTWDACNPEDGDYFYSYDIAASTDDPYAWTYFGGRDDVHFVDDYARTFATEDRSRIMEYVMTNDGMAQQITQYPAMQEKLRLICEGVRTAFDTTGWENVPWEQYLT